MKPKPVDLVGLRDPLSPPSNALGFWLHLHTGELAVLNCSPGFLRLFGQLIGSVIRTSRLCPSQPSYGNQSSHVSPALSFHAFPLYFKHACESAANEVGQQNRWAVSLRSIWEALCIKQGKASTLTGALVNGVGVLQTCLG
jgi:hypothetical protein